MRQARIEPDWESFRSAARGLLAAGVAPDHVEWQECDDAQAEMALLTAATPAPAAAARALIPRAFLELGETCACHRAPAAWPWLYRVLWRITRGERALLEDAADPDVVMLTRMQRAVRRDTHKMTAFVRFRAVQDDEGERFIAWFEPQHRIIRLTAPFFERRFPAMRWSILTPDTCVHWDGTALSFTAGVSRSHAPTADALEEFWLTYYAHTFNPARVRTRAMRAEMPVHYWKNLPEAAAIPQLLRDAPVRVRDMIERAEAAPAPVRTVPRVATRALRTAPGDVPRADFVRMPKVRVGVAGWDYPDWAGRVYPEGRDGVDRLRCVAARFDLIEVNSTFYRPASARAANSWLDRTRDLTHLRFAAKLWRSFTHERGAWRNADVAAVHAGMEPLRGAGRLVALLVQFPWSFRNEPQSRRHLQRVLDAFAAYPLHVEVRHDSWDDASFRSWLHRRDVGLASIDQPLFDGSLQPADHVTGRTAYLRLHGRNHAAWFRADATRDERYDYDYTDAELTPWIARAHSLAARDDVDHVDVVFNNHYRGQAVRNAERFRSLLATR